MKKIIFASFKSLLIVILIPITLWSVFTIGHLIFDRGEQTNKEFLRSLKGEVVYIHRDDQDLNLYKISANGEGRTLLYKNTSPAIQNRNVMNPRWSDDESRIFFTATVINGGSNEEYWNRFSIDSRGGKLVQETNYNYNRKSADYYDRIDEYLDKVGELTTGGGNMSREKDIIIERGNIYFINELGEKKLVYEYPRGFWHDNIWYPTEGIWHNGGAQEASWSPDRKYIIFMLNEGGSNEIMIVNREGTQLAKLANGRAPNWKY